jgi:hypothetical protein
MYDEALAFPNCNGFIIPDRAMDSQRLTFLSTAQLALLLSMEQSH